MAGIDLLLMVKVIVHMLVMRWDQEELEEDVGYLGSSTLGALKIVKMPLCRRSLENEKLPTSYNNPITAPKDIVGIDQSSGSSKETSKKVPCESLKHTVRIEMGQERQAAELNISSNDENKSASFATNSKHQQLSNEASARFSTKLSDDLDLYSKETQSGKVVDIYQTSQRIETLKNTEECNIPILETPVCQEESSIIVNSDNIKISLTNIPSQEDRNVSSSNTAGPDCTLQALSSVTWAQNESESKSSSNQMTGQNRLSLSNSSQRKKPLSSLKAVLSSITAIKSKTLQAKKVGFLGEIPGDRTQSDNDRRKRQRVALFSFSESGVGSKSSNTKYHSSYASYNSIDSISRDNRRQPEDHDFPQDTTSCTITTVLMGLILAALILPATFRHAVRMFGSSVSSPPTLNEIEVAILFENLIKFSTVYKFFLCVVAMSSFRQALGWLVRHWMPAKIMRMFNICCKDQDVIDDESDV